MITKAEAPKAPVLPPAAAMVAAKVRAATKAGAGFYDPAVRKLRAELADALKAALLEEHFAAQRAGVEQTLWKVVYYRPIEEFRRRIRLAADAGDRGCEPLRKAKAAFNQLLDSGAGFYRRLALDVQAVHGDSGCPVHFPGEPASPLAAAGGGAPAAPGDAGAPIDARPTVFRCLICLGDLARYQINAANEEPGRDWSPAAVHYRQAALVLPAGGNAHNQLAVLATYVGDELAAAAHYFRALAVAQPFVVARDNLLLLFEQNRIRYEAMMQGGRGRAGSRAPPPPPQQQRGLGQQPANMADFVTHFVRLHGILFTRINVDAFPSVLSGATAQLDKALQAPGMLRALTSAPGGSGHESPLMRLAVMAAAALANIDYSADGRSPGVSEALQRKELRQHATDAALQLAAAVFAAAATATLVPRSSKGGAGGEAGGRKHAGSRADLRLRLLPAAHVLLLWLATHPEVARAGATQGRPGPGRAQLLEAAGRLRDWAAGQPAAAGTASAGERTRLPELISVRGFLPLAPAGLDTAAAPRPLDRKEEHAVRLASILDCLQRLGSGEGSNAAAQQQAAAPGALQAAAQGQAGPALAPAAARAPPQPDDDDEDEEVILYAPRAVSPAPPPAPPPLLPHAAAATTPQPAAAAAVPPTPHSGWLDTPATAPAWAASPSVVPETEPRPLADVHASGAHRGSHSSDWAVCATSEGTGGGGAAADGAVAVNGGGGGAANGSEAAQGGAGSIWGGDGGLFSGGGGGGFLGRDIFAGHRASGGSIGFGLADLGDTAMGGASSGGFSGDMQANSPFAAGDADWGRPAPAPVASLWDDAAPQAISQQEQVQQRGPLPPSAQQPTPQQHQQPPPPPGPWQPPWLQQPPQQQPQPQQQGPPLPAARQWYQQFPLSPQPPAQQAQPACPALPPDAAAVARAAAAQPRGSSGQDPRQQQQLAPAPVQDWSWLNSIDAP